MYSWGKNIINSNEGLQRDTLSLHRCVLVLSTVSFQDQEMTSLQVIPLSGACIQSQDHSNKGKRHTLWWFVPDPTVHTHLTKTYLHVCCPISRWNTHLNTSSHSPRVPLNSSLIKLIITKQNNGMWLGGYFQESCLKGHFFKKFQKCIYDPSREPQHARQIWGRSRGWEGLGVGGVERIVLLLARGGLTPHPAGQALSLAARFRGNNQLRINSFSVGITAKRDLE